MAKFYGPIGYGVATEIKPGVWQDVITEHNAYGDVLRNSRGLEPGDKVNSDITVSNTISIVADEFANGHIYAMKYVVWRGARWIVSNVNVDERPRLVLRLGGLYNGPTPKP